jgi:Ternary complex associated domain 9
MVGTIKRMERDMESKILCSNYQPDRALLNVKINGKSTRGDKALQRDLLGEWENLLVHLFPQAQKILVESMVPGYSGAGIVAVRPFLEHGTGQKVVVKFGDVQQIQLEYANYINYVKPFIGGTHGTVVLDHCYMERLGGIAYTFLGTDIDDMQDFDQFYARASIAQIKQVLDHLFRRACRLWYASTSALRPLNLTELYQKQSPSNYSLKKLESVISKSLPTVLGQKTLKLDSLESFSPTNFTNPFYALKSAQPFVCSSYTTITHGDLNKRNIFVDRNDYAHLIDFGTTGPSHILRDIAMLDCVVRLDLLSVHDATLDERLKMEQVLCSMSRFSDVEQVRNGFSTTNLALMKAFDTVVHLRTLARWLVEKKPEDDMREYFVSLLYNTLGTLGFSSPYIEQHEHALLSASLLVDRLGIGNNKR